MKKIVLVEVSYHSPSEVLKNFNDIQNMCINIFGRERSIEDGVMLRWRVEFRSVLEKTVI